MNFNENHGRKITEKIPDVDGTPTIIKFKFTDKITGKTFTFHNLATGYIPKFLNNQIDKRRQKKPNKLIRNKLIKWYIDECVEEAQIKKIFSTSTSTDAAYAIVWYNCVKKFPFNNIENDQKFYHMYSISKPDYFLSEQASSLVSCCSNVTFESNLTSTKLSKFTNEIIKECQIWIGSAERLAIIESKKGIYTSFIKEWSNKVNACRSDVSMEKKKFCLIKTSSYTRKLIRDFVEKRKCLIFEWNAILNTAKNQFQTASEIKILIFETIVKFKKALEEELYCSIDNVNSRLAEIGLEHEMTRIVYHTIIKYLENLRSSDGIIYVECLVNNNQLYLQNDKIKEDLKAPIKELCYLNHVKISIEDIDEWEFLCENIVDIYADVEKILHSSSLNDYSELVLYDNSDKEIESDRKIEAYVYYSKLKQKLCFNERFVKSGPFYINMEKVVSMIQEKIDSKLKLYYDEMINDFRNNSMNFYEKIFSIYKCLSLRSVKPEIMLKNRYEVKKMRCGVINDTISQLSRLIENMHNILELLGFDGFEEVRMIEIISLYLQLEGKFREHEMFIQRRINIFHQFVKNQQLIIKNNAYTIVEKLKIFNTFSVPGEVEEYIKNLKELRPVLEKLLDNIKTLNIYEKAVDFTESKFYQCEALNEHMNNLEKLYKLTIDFQEYQNDYHSRLRYNANVQEAKIKAEYFLEQLNDLSSDLEGYRASRHFCIQLQLDIEKFKHTFPIIEILSSNRFQERHWIKISDIINIDFSQYINATVKEICNLNLYNFVQFLKPISFVAEREGIVNDQLVKLNNFWSTQTISLEMNSFWKLSLPSNLNFIISTVTKDISILESFIKNEKLDSDLNSPFNIETKLWFKQLSDVLDIATKWRLCLTRWKTLAPVIKHNVKVLHKEFHEFRICAKYFKLLEKLVKEDPLVLKFKDGKHVKCWIDLAQKHLFELMVRFKKFLEEIRKSSIRLSLISVMDLLTLLQDEPIEGFLERVRKLCFYNTKEIKLVSNGKYLLVKSLDDQEILINRDEVKLDENNTNLPLVEKILKLEQAINNKICELAYNFSNKTDSRSIMSNMEEERYIPRLSKILYYRYSKKSSSESSFNYLLTDRNHFKLLSKGDRKEISAIINFIPTLNYEKKHLNISLNFASNWSQGKVPIIRGNCYSGRLFAEQLQFLTFSELHFVNCHKFITEDAINHMLGALKQHSILLILENYEQLMPNVRSLLFSRINKLLSNEPCPNLILISLYPTKEESFIQNHCFVELTNIGDQLHGNRENTNSTSLKTRNSSSQLNSNAEISISQDVIQTPTSARRLSSFSITNVPRYSITSIKSPKSVAESLSSFLKPSNSETTKFLGMRLSNSSKILQRRRSTSSASHTSNDSKISSFQDINSQLVDGTLIGKENCIAFIGQGSKSTLKEMMKNEDYLCKWIYFDAMSPYQLLHSCSEFGEPAEGYLLKTINSIQNSSLTKNKFLIFCGSRNFTENFPFFSSLFTKNITLHNEKERNTISEGSLEDISISSNNNEIKNYIIPGPYLTLPDGSNYLISNNLKIFLCLPGTSDINKSDIDWVKRCGVQTISLQGLTYQTLSDSWIEYVSKINEFINFPEHMEIIASTFEFIIQPIWNFVNPPHYVCPSLLMEYIIKDLIENIKSITSSNYGEVLRWTITSVGVNFIIIYYSSDNDIELFNKQMTIYGDEAENNFMIGVPLPNNISDFKLSQLEFCKWIEWKNEITFKSILDKELSLSEIIITYPHFDRLLTYALRAFKSMNKHLLIHGPKGCGKTTFVKRFIKYFEEDSIKYNIIWLNTTDRLNLTKVQSKFYGVIDEMEKNFDSHETIFIIDNFTFEEYIISLVELFLDQHTTVLVNGSTKKCHIAEKVKFIIILQNKNDISTIKKYDIIYELFYIIPLYFLREKEIEQIVEEVFDWHLNIRSFSSEYQSLVCSLTKTFTEILPTKKYMLSMAIKILKGTMFSWPETTPDFDSFCRLWVHETLRVCYDKLNNQKDKDNLLLKIEKSLKKHCQSSFEILFKKEDEIEDISMDEFTGLKDDEHVPFLTTYQEKNENLKVSKNFRVSELLFTEVCNGIDVIEGIPYGLLYNLGDFTSHMSNLVYELYRSNDIKKPMNLIITDYIANQCQRIMRICRMSNEHMAFVGERGSGRRNCVKLANIALVGHIEHVYLSTLSIEAFEESWRICITKCIESIASTNVIITLLFYFDDDDIPNISYHSFLMLKQWFETYDIMEFITDDILLKLGEKIIESEKGLATQEQANNIRLPGQRKCNFLPVEAIKDTKTLKYILSQRFSDFVHAIFLIPPGSERYFKWCTINHFSYLKPKDINVIIEKQLQDLIEKPNEEELNTLVNVIFKICFNTEELVNNIHMTSLKKIFNIPTRSNFQVASNFVQIFNKKYTKLYTKYKEFCIAISTLNMINELSQIGGNIDNNDLAKDLDNEELSYLMLSKERNKKRVEYDEIKKNLENIENDKNLSLKETFSHQKILKEKIEKPLIQVDNIKKNLLSIDYEEFRKLSFIKKPSAIIRDVVDGVRILLQPSYKPTKNTIQNWNSCQPFLRSKSLIDKLCNFNTAVVDDKLLGSLKRYTKFNIYRVNQIVDESKLAFYLCKWLLATITLIETERNLVDNKKIILQMDEKIKTLDDKIIYYQKKKETIFKKLQYLENETKACEYEVSRLRKQLDYRVRGSKIINNVYFLINNWKEKLSLVSDMLKNLKGNSILYSSFRVLTSFLGSDIKLRALNIWKSILRDHGISFNETSTDIDYFLKEAFIDTSWKMEWPLICPETSKKDNLFIIKQTDLLKSKILKFYPQSVVIDFLLLNQNNNNNSNDYVNDKKIYNNDDCKIQLDNGNKKIQQTDISNKIELEKLWMNKSLLMNTLKALRNGNELIFVNIPCIPPIYWMHLIEREIDVSIPQDDLKKNEEDGKNNFNPSIEIILQFNGNKILVNKNFKLFMISEKDISSIELSFLRKVWPLTLNEGMDLQQSSSYILDEEVVENLSSESETFLLRKMTDYSANDILESQDLTDQIIHHGRTFTFSQHSRTF
ncbi:Dynein heavy chain, domain-2 and P-loop containing nucleoside triphosphate hydrolase domain-containing protein [Strongyloides ratti]|uniref:Dynein heavy chain, domain-2 and P-loop containing nucleoside triphosphate hydrolase domain-containing protein n=1 Tax=Strongyloides ratti TaxID=34506 RepID=A0A090LET2_STRRB|nr:Dynein heavy chain, domain-2 and P-loop containing nucleoside triphosphate hydrolase domain-containing protein [Strongyloides ratti]CEF68276.1 Dynein heavy chain, domain-2 and P-loop containing nucleoside triphosphate hydrolase domain-containing protein [Strongyloides ratti]